MALAASIGWAVDDGIARSDELVHHADARMYEAKWERAARPRQQDR